jgi:hypothetical protein
VDALQDKFCNKFESPPDAEFAPANSKYAAANMCFTSTNVSFFKKKTKSFHDVILKFYEAQFGSPNAFFTPLITKRNENQKCN